jgi:hypothetical protein
MNKLQNALISAFSNSLPTVIKMFVVSLLLTGLLFVSILFNDSQVLKEIYRVSLSSFFVIAILLAATRAIVDLPMLNLLILKGLQYDQLKKNIEDLEKKIDE